MQKHVDTESIPPERGREFHIHCIACGSSSPVFCADEAIGMWVALHPCSVPEQSRTWFLTYLGEEMGD